LAAHDPKTLRVRRRSARSMLPMLADLPLEPVKLGIHVFVSRSQQWCDDEFRNCR